jgi:hypothetical protein
MNAATATIREALADLSAQTAEGAYANPADAIDPALITAVENLERLAEAARIVYREFHGACEYPEEQDLRDALVAIGDAA